MSRRIKEIVTALSYIGAILTLVLVLLILDSTYNPPTAKPPELVFKTEPSEVLYPQFGAVTFWWNNTYWVVDYDVWLEKTS